MNGEVYSKIPISVLKIGALEAQSQPVKCVGTLLCQPCRRKGYVSALSLVFARSTFSCIVTDYAPADYKVFYDLQHMDSVASSYAIVKTLDARLKGIIIAKLHAHRAKKRKGVRTTAKSMGQDFRHNVDKIFDLVSLSHQC